MGEITELLGRWRDGDQGAFDEMFPLLYGELRRLAQAYLGSERPGHTLQGTALVHEAYLRLVRQDRVEWRDRGHFIAVAAQAMRRVLVDHSRRRSAAKRSPGEAAPLSTELILGGGDFDFEALDQALNRLAERGERRAKVVELRYFGGMKEHEIAEHLNISPATVRRDWTVARAWLFRELNPGAASAEATVTP